MLRRIYTFKKPPLWSTLSQRWKTWAGKISPWSCQHMSICNSSCTASGRGWSMGGRGGTREERWHLFIYFTGNLKYANFKVNIVIHEREGTQCSSVIWGILWWYYALIRWCTLTNLLTINGEVDGFLRSLFLFLKYLTTKDADVFFNFFFVKAYLAWLEAFLLIYT